MDNYGRLYSILMSAQSNPEQENDLSLNQGLLDTDFRILSDPSDGTDPNDPPFWPDIFGQGADWRHWYQRCAPVNGVFLR